MFQIHRDNHREIALSNKHQCIQKYEHGDFCSWYIKSTLYKTEGLKLKQNFQKTKLLTAKNLFFMIDPFCTSHFICLNIGFWHASFVREWCVFNLSAFNQETILQFFGKGFRFPENLFQSYSIENVQNFHWLSQTCWSYERRDIP